MKHEDETSHAIVIHKDTGEEELIDEWFSLRVAKKVAAKAWEARVGVVNSPVVAIEIVDYENNSVQIVRFD